jgi:hypothetical protein
MKNLLETISIALVGLLSLSIVFFIVQYNLIEDDSIVEDINFDVTPKKITQKAKAANYLNTLEGYGDDVDVKVDATKENTANTVVVKSELQKDELGDVVQDKSKSSYMENLAEYSEEAEKNKLDELKPSSSNAAQPQKLENAEIVDQSTMDISKDIGSVVEDQPEKSTIVEDDPEKLEQDEIVDEIGMAIDAALSDL